MRVIVFVVAVLVVSHLCACDARANRAKRPTKVDASLLPVWRCPKLPPSPPAQDVRHLRPQDIKAVMAMGDSITAGFAMKSEKVYDSVKDIVEYRGDVFSVGAESTPFNNYTLFHYINFYNKNVTGGAEGVTIPNTARILQPKKARLNAAISGAHVQDLFSQVDYLKKQLQSQFKHEIDFKNDWKLVTIFIGANNLCGSCHVRNDSNPVWMGQQLDQVLAKLHNDIPRVFVNLMTIFNISQVYDYAHKNLYCRTVWSTVSECSCMTGKATDQDRQMIDNHVVQWNAQVYNVAAKWESMNYKDFTVRVQPFGQNQQIPSLDVVSKLDCFHPSLVSNEFMSVGLWNNMLTPAAQKNTSVDIGIQYKCPTSTTYLQ